MIKQRNLDLDKILAAATELIETEGVSQTTLPNLAKKLGVRSQSLYHYVKNRHQLISLVGANHINQLNELLRNKLIGTSGKPALIEFADLIRSFILEDKALAAILYHLREYALDDAITQAVMKILALGHQLNSSTDSAISAHVLVGAVLGFVFFDNSPLTQKEDAAQTDHDYHEMILRLVDPQ